VRYRDVMPINRIRYVNSCSLVQVSHDLMAKEIPVDPRVGASSLRAAEYSSVERCGGGEVVYGNCEMKTRVAHSCLWW
jgi:hypothetical protein